MSFLSCSNLNRKILTSTLKFSSSKDLGERSHYRGSEGSFGLGGGVGVGLEGKGSGKGWSAPGSGQGQAFL